MLAALSCRDIRPPTAPADIAGYRIDGALTDADGFPVSGAEVVLFYTADDAGFGPIDTVQAVVTDSTKTVDVSVYTLSYRFVRTLYFGLRHPGPIPRFIWDGRDDNNRLVPSGMYLVGYQIGDTVYKYVPVVVDGLATDTTDGNGNFSITNANLPIGRLFDYYDAGGTYVSTLRIAPAIDLIFRKGSVESSYTSIPLVKDKVTSASFTL